MIGTVDPFLMSGEVNRIVGIDQILVARNPRTRIWSASAIAHPLVGPPWLISLKLAEDPIVKILQGDERATSRYVRDAGDLASVGFSLNPLDWPAAVVDAAESAVSDIVHGNIFNIITSTAGSIISTSADVVHAAENVINSPTGRLIIRHLQAVPVIGEALSSAAVTAEDISDAIQLADAVLSDNPDAAHIVNNLAAKAAEGNEDAMKAYAVYQEAQSAINTPEAQAVVQVATAAKQSGGKKAPEEDPAVKAWAEQNPPPPQGTRAYALWFADYTSVRHIYSMFGSGSASIARIFEGAARLAALKIKHYHGHPITTPAGGLITAHKASTPIPAVALAALPLAALLFLL